MTGTKLFDILGFNSEEIQKIIQSEDEAFILNELQVKYSEKMRKTGDITKRKVINDVFDYLSNPLCRKQYIDFIKKYKSDSRDNSIYALLTHAVLNHLNQYATYLVENVIDDKFDKKLLIAKFKEQKVKFNANNSTCPNWIEILLKADCKPKLKFQLLFCFIGEYENKPEFSERQLTSIQKNNWLGVFREQFKLNALAPILKYLQVDTLSTYLQLQKSLQIKDLIPGWTLHEEHAFEKWLESVKDDHGLRKKCFSRLIEYGLRPTFNTFKKALSNPLKLEHLRILADYERLNPFLTAEQVSKLFLRAIKLPNEPYIRDIFHILLLKSLRGITSDIFSAAVKFPEGNAPLLLEAVHSCLVEGTKNTTYNGARQTLVDVDEWFKKNEGWLDKFNEKFLSRLRALPGLFRRALKNHPSTGDAPQPSIPSELSNPPSREALPISELVTSMSSGNSPLNVNAFWEPPPLSSSLKRTSTSSDRPVQQGSPIMNSSPLIFELMTPVPSANPGGVSLATAILPPSSQLPGRRVLAPLVQRPPTQWSANALDNLGENMRQKKSAKKPVVWKLEVQDHFNPDQVRSHRKRKEPEGNDPAMAAASCAPTARIC